MAYSKKVKESARRMWRQGYSIIEISEKLRVNRDTIQNWKRDANWDQIDDMTLEGIRHQINLISTATQGEEMTTKQTWKLDRLTRALQRLTGVSERKDRNVKAKPALDIQVVGDLKSKFVDLLFEYQRKFFLDQSRFRINLKSRQTGFSYETAGEMIFRAIERQIDQVLISASDRQADLVRQYAVKWAEKLGIDLIPDKGELVAPGGARLKFLPSNFRTIQGNTGDLYLDEFAWHINNDRIYLAAYPTITIGDRRLTIVSSPYVSTDKFGDIWQNKEKYPRFSRHQVTIEDAVRDGLPVDLDEIRSGIDPETFLMLYMCEFFSDELSIFRVGDVQAAMTDSCLMHVDRMVNGGMDIGRHRDLSEIVLSEEIKADNLVYVRDMLTLKKMPYEEQSDFVLSLMQDWTINSFMIDRTGIGDPVYERLAKRHPSTFYGVWMSQEWKSKLVLAAMRLFEQKRIKIPNDRDFVAQLHSLKRKPTSTGFTYDSDRNEQIKHADKAWAFMLSVFEFGESKNGEITEDDVCVI